MYTKRRRTHGAMSERKFYIAVPVGNAKLLRSGAVGQSVVLHGRVISVGTLDLQSLGKRERIVVECRIPTEDELRAMGYPDDPED